VQVRDRNGSSPSTLHPAGVWQNYTSCVRRIAISARLPCDLAGGVNRCKVRGSCSYSCRSCSSCSHHRSTAPQEWSQIVGLGSNGLVVRTTFGHAPETRHTRALPPSHAPRRPPYYYYPGARIACINYCGLGGTAKHAWAAWPSSGEGLAARHRYA